MSTEDDSTHAARVLIQGLEKRFDDRSVLQNIDLDVPAGAFLTVVGRSGCGKTTLLRILSGLEEPTQGTAQVISEGRETTADVRVVFQDPRLLPWRSVLDNVLIGLPKSAEAAARQVLESVGLGDRLSEYPRVLSGGQKQRVALARALTHEPSLMLLDEPFGALDALTRIDAQKLVERLWSKHGFTAILVTHDVLEAVLLGDRVLVVADGRIKARFEVALPRPRRRDDPEVARLTGAVLDAIFDGTASDAAAADAAEDATESVRAGGVRTVDSATRFHPRKEQSHDTRHDASLAATARKLAAPFRR